jgi:hypothetical protein
MFLGFDRHRIDNGTLEPIQIPGVTAKNAFQIDRVLIAETEQKPPLNG